MFLDYLNDNALSQMVNTPTRGSNILDIFVTNRPTLVETCDTIDGISDHEAVLVVSSVIANLSNPSKRVVYLWAQADFNAIRNNMQTLCDNFLDCFSTSTPVEVLWNEFLSICNSGVPTKVIASKCKNPWINNITTLRGLLVESSGHTTKPAILTHQQTGPSTKDSVRENAAQLTGMCLTLLTRTKTRLPNVYVLLLRAKGRTIYVGISTLKHQGETFVDATDKANVFADYFFRLYL